MNYVENFVGHFDLNQDFIKAVRKNLRLSGFRLWIRGGNPDRKQHVGKKVTSNMGVTYTVYHAGLRQSLPLEFSTYGRFYLRGFDIQTDTKLLSLGQAKSVFTKTLNQFKGVNLKSNVPTDL